MITFIVFIIVGVWGETDNLWITVDNIDRLGITRVVLQEDPANFTTLATFEPHNLHWKNVF